MLAATAARPGSRFRTGSSTPMHDNMTVVLAAEPAGEPPELAALAYAVGAEDVFVFVRTAVGHWTNRGGIGRGADWAGNVELLADNEPGLRAVTTRTQVVRVAADPAASGPGRAAHVIGPYFATSAALVRVDEKTVVVLGRRALHGEGTTALRERSGAELACCPDARLEQLAGEFALRVAPVTPAKVLADELEVLHAVQAVTRSLDMPFLPALEHVVTVAVRQLRSHAAFALTGRGDLAVAERGWLFKGNRDELGQTLGRAFGGEPHALWVDDATHRPLAEPLSVASGVRAYASIPIAPPVGGVLVVIRSDADPRGFTALDRRIADQLIEAASVLLQVADLRQELQQQVVRSSHEARHDPLTEVANRLAWDESLAEAQRVVEMGGQVSLVIADLDGLKATNDRHGHAAGDRLIQSLAGTLRGAIRGHDLVARLGGDEFGILLPDVGDADADRALERLRGALSDVRTPDELPVLASLGVATCPAYGSVNDTWRDADQAMYAEKRRHHARTRARRSALAAVAAVSPVSVTREDAASSGLQSGPEHHVGAADLHHDSGVVGDDAGQHDS